MIKKTYVGFSIISIWLMVLISIWIRNPTFSADDIIFLTVVGLSHSALIILVANFVRKKGHAAGGTPQEILSHSAERTLNPVILIDAIGNIEWANPSFERVTEYDRVKVISSNLSSVLRGDCEECLKSSALANTRSRRLVRDVQIERRQNGSVWVQISIDPVFEGSDSPSHFIVTLGDVTERKLALDWAVDQCDQLERIVAERTRLIRQKSDELSAALARQREVNEQQRNFVSMASHEFRTPLAIIDSAAQKLKGRAASLTPEEIVQRADTIRKGVKRMTDLMESVLSAAKFEDGRAIVSIENCDLHQVVRDCCLKQREINSSHTIQMDIEELPRLSRIDPKAIEQVITNLLANAVKFSPKANVIEVRGKSDLSHIRIEIQDFGLGIDEDDLPKIFTRYHRARTSVGIAGTGIGLSVVKTIIEQHRGEIKVTSHKGKGSVFMIVLPVECAITSRPSGSCDTIENASIAA